MGEVNLPSVCGGDGDCLRWLSLGPVASGVDLAPCGDGEVRRGEVVVVADADEHLIPVIRVEGRHNPGVTAAIAGAADLSTT